MGEVSFCTCKDHKCPFNPVNHDRGCEFCVAKCLKEGEIPSCFFHKISDNMKSDDDYSYLGFAKLVMEQQ